jgi:DNA damage-binding protein 1
MVLEWDAVNQELQIETTHYGNVLALSLATRGDLVIVGDLMKSISCLFYDPTVPKVLTEYGRDYDTNWMTAVESIDGNTFIGADHYGNLFTVRKEPESKRLIPTSRFHLGERVNRFRAGKSYRID